MHSLKIPEAEGNFRDNSQNLLILVYFLAKFMFTTTEMDLDYHHEKLTSRVVKRLKTLGNEAILVKSQFECRNGLVPGLSKVKMYSTLNYQK